MNRLPASAVVLLAAALVTLLLLLLGQTPWAQGIREAASPALANSATKDPHGVTALILPFAKVLMVMLVPGLIAIGLSNLVNTLRQQNRGNS
ncbi:MAG: hypothetical protein IVW51_01760 [Thermaceae bacterium]|nr:hypothetical protein [Thermaceae bacterium]